MYVYTGAHTYMHTQNLRTKGSLKHPLILHTTAKVSASPDYKCHQIIGA